MTILTCPGCNREVSALYHVAGYPGEYCVQCKPESTPRPDPFVEDVNGIVIGPMLFRYEFWTTDNQNRIARCDKESDAEAQDWFRAEYPAEYKAGVLMRCYD